MGKPNIAQMAGRKIAFNSQYFKHKCNKFDIKGKHDKKYVIKEFHCSKHDLKFEHGRQWHTWMNDLQNLNKSNLKEIVSGQQLESKIFTIDENKYLL